MSRGEVNGQRATRGGTRRRQDEVLRLVRAGVTRVPEIADQLGVSTSTVRRDLSQLQSSGRVARTYGGATAGLPFVEQAIADRMRTGQAAKAAIGRAAAELVSDGSTIFVDAGSTCAQLVEYLRGRRLVVLTRGLEIALALAGEPGIEVVVIGGSVAPASHGLVGGLALDGLRAFRTDVAFLGADAVHPADGVGEPTLSEAQTKQVAAERAHRVVVLADASKIGRVGVPAWAALPTGWLLVTDESEQERLAGFVEAGVRVETVTL